jgi:hypothetical protein
VRVAPVGTIAASLARLDGIAVQAAPSIAKSE